MRQNYGLTLIELIIAISLLGMVMLSAVAINIAANRFLLSEDSQARLSRQASLAMELISKDISLSFGDPANSAFQILAPGPNSGNALRLRREDRDPLQVADANDRWVSYLFDVSDNTIRFNDGASGNLDIVVEDVVTVNDIFQASPLNDNLIRIEITTRQDPTQPPSITNPQTTLVSAVRIPAIASQ